MNNGFLNVLIFDGDVCIAGTRSAAARTANAGDPAVCVAGYAAVNGFKIKSVNLILKTFECALRFEQLPKLNDGDLRGFVENNIDDYFPMPLEGYTVSYRRWPGVGADFVCLAAAPDTLTRPYMEAFTRLKINVNKIDIYQNAAADFLKLSETAALVALKKGSRINATLIQNGRILAARDMHDSGETVVFARMYGLDIKEMKIYAADFETDFITAFLPGYEIMQIDSEALATAYA